MARYGVYLTFIMAPMYVCHRSVLGLFALLDSFVILTCNYGTMRSKNLIFTIKLLHI